MLTCHLIAGDEGFTITAKNISLGVLFCTDEHNFGNLSCVLYCSARLKVSAGLSSRNSRNADCSPKQ